MAKTTSKTGTSKSKKAKVKKTKAKSKAKKTSVKKTVAARKSSVRKSSKSRVRKIASKKKAVRKSKKVTKKSSRPVKKTKTPELKVDFKKIMDNKVNIIKILIILVVLGAFYLLKEVFVVATVNGAPVFRWSVIARLEEQGGRQILDSLVTEKLVDQAIKESGVVIEQEEIDVSLLEIEARLSSQGMELEQALTEQGMTREELVEDLVLQKSVERIVADSVEVTDEEVDAYILENKEFFPEGTDEALIRKDVREQLKSLSINEKIQAWVQDLQDNSNVVYFKEYERVGLQ